MQELQAAGELAQQNVFLGIPLREWLMMLAILMGPVTALALQRLSERRRGRKERKLTVFKELMATRAPSARVTPRHVDALNAIEMEFSGGKGSDKKVTDAWRLYLDHLNDRSKADNADAGARWVDKADDLLVSLLYEMSGALSYSFDKVSLKNGIYYPKAHGDLEFEQYQLRQFVLELLAGKRVMWTGIVTGDNPIRMEVTNLGAAQPQVQPPQDAPAINPPPGQPS